MTSMRERIARALARDALEHNGHSYSGDQLEFYAGQTWRNYLRQADAVLPAMREPTEEMLARAVPEPTHLYGKDGRGAKYKAQMQAAVLVDRAVVARHWRALVDAASCDSGGDRNGGDANAAPCGASQSGDAASGASPEHIVELWESGLSTSPNSRRGM